MNFRTSHLVGLLATGLVAFAAPSINPVVAEPLKITGPDGQVKQSIRQYGPTTSADTFWSIAQALKPDNSVTVYQVMAALYDANPHAFSSKNYNSLERGMILLVPTKAVMQQISKTDAKARAERNDRNWSTASAKPSVAATSVVAKPVTPEPVAVKVETPKATVAKSTVAAKSNPLITELSAQVDALTKQVEDIQAQNLALTDELARASDEIVVGSSDTEAFQQEIAELKQENALLKQALQDTKSENQALNQEVQLKQQQLGAISAPKQEPTSDLWRTLMDNPLLLVLGAVLPALLVVALFWLFIRRRNDANSEQESEQAAEKELSGMNDDTSIDEKSDDADGLAVHLDTDDAAEQAPLKELAVVGAASLAEQEEQDIVVEDSNDEGQSLDDLWAEAMGEQDQNEANDFDAFEKQSKSVEEDDLDSLLAGFDDPVAQTDSDLTINEKPSVEQESTQDDLDALLAGFDEPAEQTEQNLSVNEQPFVAQDSEQQSTADDDLDALLAGFDEQSFVAQETDLESTQDEDLDALLASFDEPAEQTAEAPADDIDALLADFDSANQQLEQADEPEVKAAEDDLDALLAELDDQTDNEANTAKHTVNNTESDVDALSDEMAAELELGFEIAAELDLSDDDAGQEKLDSELDSELDALLADFDTPIDAKDSELELEPEPQLESEPQDAIATELALTESAAIDETLDELKETPEVSAKDSNSLDFDLSDFEPSSVKANTDAEPSNNHDEELLEFTLPEPELEQELSSELDPQVIEKTDKESGFFDDLKGNKKAEENSLDWESIAAQSGNDAPAAPNAELATELAFSEAEKVEVSDDELLSGLVSKGSAQDTTLDLDTDETFSLDNDSKMTVDEALAALDAEELGGKEPSKSAVAMHDLTSFQKDNGFIDIDRLLSEADEDSGEIDLYKELDVDMGELDSLKGNTPMVDVDDEENSVNAKLDLARAYIEIDDSDSARALLKEVELDGNDRQQAEALGLLKELV